MQLIADAAYSHTLTRRMNLSAFTMKALREIASIEERINQLNGHSGR